MIFEADFIIQTYTGTAGTRPSGYGLGGHVEYNGTADHSFANSKGYPKGIGFQWDPGVNGMRLWDNNSYRREAWIKADTQIITYYSLNVRFDFTQ